MPKQGAKGLSPREVFKRAVILGPLRHEELIDFNTQRAREMERAEARRRGQSPQAPLPLHEAA